ncbi:MAG: CHASE2 domain-containing protein [Bdellovibrionota bacterium]
MKRLISTIFSAIKKKKFSILLCAAIVTTCWYLLFDHYRHGNELVQTMESFLLDYRFVKRGIKPARNKVGILAIDDQALQDFGRWPFSRRYYSQAFDNLKKLGVRWIGFDSILRSQKDLALKMLPKP